MRRARGGIEPNALGQPLTFYCTSQLDTRRDRAVLCTPRARRPGRSGRIRRSAHAGAGEAGRAPAGLARRRQHGVAGVGVAAMHLWRVRTRSAAAGHAKQPHAHVRSVGQRHTRLAPNSHAKHHVKHVQGSHPANITAGDVHTVKNFRMRMTFAYRSAGGRRAVSGTVARTFGSRRRHGYATARGLLRQ